MFAREGIVIYDGPDGQPVGRSVVAGKWALAQVAATRAVLPLPSMLWARTRARS